jgi:hypothetical protein
MLEQLTPNFELRSKFKQAFETSNATESQACNFAELSLLQLILCGDAV